MRRVGLPSPHPSKGGLPLDVKKRLPSRSRPPQGRIAKIRLAPTAAWKVLRTTFAVGAVKGAAAARAKRSKRKRRVSVIAGAGAGVAAVGAVAVRKRTKASANQEEHYDVQEEHYDAPPAPPLQAAEAAP